ncbi:MAG: DUF4417 domain-containing protein [Eubacteriaceae bacterium]|nr:DUF4417 domain-containing protein [Eubacteriaceae bacterium]
MEEAKEVNKITNLYVRTLFLSYLVEGAERTKPDGYPIIEKWMVATKPPEEVFQWDCRYEVTNPETTGMSFYCRDEKFAPILNNPRNYVDKLSKYACVIGLDASPYDNMPLAVQKSQIYANLATTYFFGAQGLIIIPNVRLGNDETIGMLDAIPKECLIAVGTNGFTWNLENRKVFRDQMAIVVDTLRPTGIIVYGPAYDYVFQYAMDTRIPIYQYDSHTMKRNAERQAEAKKRSKMAKSNKELEGDLHKR